MKRLFAAGSGLLAALLICLALPALGEGPLAWTTPPELIRPGKTIRLSFSAALAGDADVSVKDASGATVARLAQAYAAKAGHNHLSWDGRAQGAALAPGHYTLEVAQGDASAAAQVLVGEESPAFMGIRPSDTRLSPGDGFFLQVETNREATLLLALKEGAGETILKEALLPAGSHRITWDGTRGGEAVPPGSHLLSLKLVDATGFSSNEEQLALVVEAPAAPAQAQEVLHILQDAGHSPAYAPGDFSPHDCGHDACFYRLPMGVMDEAAIWEAMMQPMTVVKGEQRQVVRVYAEPSEDSDPVGEVTCDSQGLHVLEHLDNGWSLVEAYSSSIHSSRVKVWAKFFTGYIQTSRLEVKEPNPNVGLLLDKLTQRMYVFQDGKIITELLVSTGLPNQRQPYNETPAGEFMIVSWTGGFWSGNMWCDMALRINGGILIHEVPCLIAEDGTRNYAPFERLLGEKASHGCIRVQRRPSPEGVNMRWLWDNMKRNTRVFIWDDVGRSIPLPEGSTPLYYNPDGGQYYHSDAYCASVRDRYLPLAGFAYGQLEQDPYHKLTPCPACAPPMRQGEIEELNAATAQMLP